MSLSCFAFLQQKVVFCSVKEALEVDWGSDSAAAALKRTAPDYFLLQGEAWAPGAIPAAVAAESSGFLVCPESSSTLAGAQWPQNHVSGDEACHRALVS